VTGAPAATAGARPSLSAKEKIVIGTTATFLIVAVVAALLGLSGVAGLATSIAWMLFVVGLILAVVFAVLGRRVV
jgi:uncharacterized membrane protein YtjA (UPF0391 family)